MGGSDVISKVTKQNMNVMASTSTSPCKCKICISSNESDVYNKKKIQMFVVNMTFISSREVKKMYISFVPLALMKYTFFHFTRWNKSHIHSKHLNILYIFQKRRREDLNFNTRNKGRHFFQLSVKGKHSWKFQHFRLPSLTHTHIQF